MDQSNMMAITLNLLAEEQLAQERRAQDPFKAAVAIGAALLALTVATGVMISMLASQKRTEANVLEGRLKELTTSKLMEQETAWQSAENAVQHVVTINKSRTLLAPQLAMLKYVLPSQILLTRVHYGISMEAKDAASDAAEEGESGKRAARPKLTERLLLRLEGEAVGNRPELEVDTFIQTLRNDPKFSGDVARIQLKSIARSGAGGEAGTAKLPRATFVIECQYKDKEGK